jgi:hypothetical protein
MSLIPCLFSLYSTITSQGARIGISIDSFLLLCVYIVPLNFEICYFVKYLFISSSNGRGQLKCILIEHSKLQLVIP